MRNLLIRGIGLVSFPLTSCISRCNSAAALLAAAFSLAALLAAFFGAAAAAAAALFAWKFLRGFRSVLRGAPAGLGAGAGGPGAGAGAGAGAGEREPLPPATKRAASLFCDGFEPIGVCICARGFLPSAAAAALPAAAAAFVAATLVAVNLFPNVPPYKCVRLCLGGGNGPCPDITTVTQGKNRVLSLGGDPSVHDS